MFNSLRKAYNAGWRAGRCGAEYGSNPFSHRQFLLSYCWFAGWETGIKKRLNTWLTNRRA